MSVLKERLRQTLLSLAAAFLLWQSISMLMFAHELHLSSFGLMLFLAWLFNMYITGIFAFMVFAFPAERLLPESYYRIRDAENLKILYQSLQVGVFKKFLLLTFWRSKRQKQKYFSGGREGLAGLDIQARKSEFGHVIPFVLLTVISLYFMLLGFIAFGLLTMAINIIGNGYPVILQRHHRMRLARLLRR